MTIQPFKNDKGVAPMVSNAKTSISVNEVVHLNSSLVQNSTQPNTKIVEKGQENFVLSGAAKSPGKETATQLTVIRGDINMRTQKATVVRAARQVENHLEVMKQAIHFTKNFPPFSSEDGKRKEYLMAIAGIRDQIQEMTLPPPPPAIPSSGMWADLFRGIDIPDLPVTSSDSQVQSAYVAVTAAQTTLAERRATLVQQTMPSNSMTPTNALLSSIQLGQQLSATGGTISVSLSGELQNL